MKRPVLILQGSRDTFGTPEEFAGILPAMAPAPDREQNWGQFVLPALLFLAVSLLCVMAWKLSSSMKRGSPQ